MKQMETKKIKLYKNKFKIKQKQNKTKIRIKNLCLHTNSLNSAKDKILTWLIKPIDFL
jgi:hypothetical protein